MKNILLITLLVFFSSKSWSQEWVWGMKASGNNQHSEDTDIAVDHEGNIIIAGYYELGLKLDTFSLYTKDNYYSDIYLCRMDSERNIEWLKHIETGSTYDNGIGVCINDDKNIYLTGGRNGKIFVSKYDSTGNEIWFCDFNEKYYGHGNDVGVDQFDNVYITAKNNGNTFVAKVDYYGKPIWTKIFTGCHSNGCHGNDIAVDKTGTIYLTGSFACNSLMIDDIEINNYWRWGEQTFITKISTDGFVQWAKTPVGITNTIPQITLNSYGALISTVTATSPMDFGNGIAIHKTAGGNDGSPFIAQYDFDGNVKWAKIINTYHGGQGTPRDIVTDLDDNIYLTGQAFGGYGGTEMDLYIEKYNPTGGFLWNKMFKTSIGEYSHVIGIDSNGNCYNVGYSEIQDFILGGINQPPFSVGIAKLNTNSTTNLRPYRPKVQRLNIICPETKFNGISAIGENVKWYSDKYLKELFYEGNFLNINLAETDSFYVTQTVNGIESWAKEVIIHFSKISNTNLHFSNDTLSVNHGDHFKYQWFLNGDSIKNGNRYFIIVDTVGTFSVNIKEGACEKRMDTTMVSSSIEKHLQEERILIFPNPTIDGMIHLVARIDSVSIINIRLVSLNGSTFINREFTIKDGLIIDVIDLSDYSSGIYFLNIFGDGINMTKKILKY